MDFPHRPSRRLRALVLVAAFLAAGCGVANVPPPASGSAAPAATASSSAAPAESSSSEPSPTSPANAAIAVLDGLRAFAAADDTTYRVTLRGTSRHSADTLTVKGTLDVSGDDAALAVRFTFPRGSASVDYRRVAGKDWARVDGGTWRGVSGADPAEVIDPFAGTHDGTRIQYLGPVDGEPGHHEVQLTGMYLHPALIPASNLTDEKVKRTKLVLVTDADGTPIRGTWSMHGEGRVSGQLQAIQIDLTLTFSKVGEPLTIKAP